MYSLARRWPAEHTDHDGEASGQTRRCKLQVNSYIPRHSDGVGRRQDLRDKTNGRTRGIGIRRTRGKQFDVSDSSVDSGSGGVDLDSQPVGIFLTPPHDRQQASRIARLENQLQNRAESLRKLVDDSGDLKETPFRHRLGVVPETVALTSRSEPPDLGNVKDKWLPNESVQASHRETVSSQNSQSHSYRERSPRREHADLTADEGLGASNEMKTHNRDDINNELGFLPVINLSGNLALIDTSSDTSCTSRSTGQGLRPNKLSSPQRKSLNNLSGGYISGRQITESSEPAHHMKKSTKVSSPTPTEKDLYQNVISSYSQRNHHTPQSRTKKNSKRRKKRHGDSPPIDPRRSIELPPVDTNHHKATLVGANSLSPPQDPGTPSTDLTLPPGQVDLNATVREVDTPRPSSPEPEEDVRGTVYNFVGTSSKAGRVRTYTLKELADIHHDKSPLYRDSTSDRMWKSKVNRDQRVFDVSSYDNFARKGTRKSSQLAEPTKPGVMDSSRGVNREAQHKLKNESESLSGSDLSSLSLTNKDIHE